MKKEEEKIQKTLGLTKIFTLSIPVEFVCTSFAYLHIEAVSVEDAINKIEKFSDKSLRSLATEWVSQLSRKDLLEEIILVITNPVSKVLRGQIQDVFKSGEEGAPTPTDLVNLIPHHREDD